MKKSADKNQPSMEVANNNLNRTMTYQEQVNDMSYYKTYLLCFMQSSHPRYIVHHNFTPEVWELFLTQRSEMAEIEAEKQINEGRSQDEAEQYAREVLLEGLKFSSHDTIIGIMEERYPHIYPTFSQNFIEALEDSCVPIISRYILQDDFEATSEYKVFTAEIQKHIHQYLIDNYKNV